MKKRKHNEFITKGKGIKPHNRREGHFCVGHLDRQPPQVYSVRMQVKNVFSSIDMVHGDSCGTDSSKHLPSGF